MKFLVFAAILVVGQATKLKFHVPKEAADYLQDLSIDDVPKKITVHLNGINPSDILPLLSGFSDVQEDAPENKIRLHLHGAGLNQLLSALDNFAPLLEGGSDAPHIKIHLKQRAPENDKVTKMSKEEFHDVMENFLANMKVNDPELHKIYTTDDRAHEFKEKRSVHDIAKEKLLADLSVSRPDLHKHYMSLPADQQDAFLGGLISGIGNVAKGVGSIATGAVGLVGGAVHGAAKGIIGVGKHLVEGAVKGCKSGVLGCVGGAIGGTVKGAGNAVVETLGGAHKGAHIGLNIFDKHHKKHHKCADDTSAACAGYAAAGRCTVNAQWTNYMRVACPSSCCGKIAAAPCVDKMNCAAYKPYCHAPKYVASLKHHCRKTCHFC